MRRLSKFWQWWKGKFRHPSSIDPVRQDQAVRYARKLGQKTVLIVRITREKEGAYVLVGAIEPSDAFLMFVDKSTTHALGQKLMVGKSLKVRFNSSPEPQLRERHQGLNYFYNPGTYLRADLS